MGAVGTPHLWGNPWGDVGPSWTPEWEKPPPHIPRIRGTPMETVGTEVGSLSPQDSETPPVA